MCTVGSVLAMRKGEIFYAGILGMASALTRLPGILLFVLLIIETWPKNTKNLKLNFNFVYIYLIKENFIWILLVPFGVILYFSYLWYLTGEPFAYFIAQKGWEKELVTPLHHIIKWLEKPLNFKDYLQLFPALFLTLIVIYGYNRIRFSYYTYLLIYYLIIFSSSNLLGFGRYASSIFPLFLILVVISKNYSIFNYLFLITFSMLSPVIYGIWFGWYNSF